MVFDRQQAIEEIVKDSFTLTENQAIHIAGVIFGMKMANSLQSESNKPKKRG